MKKDKEEIEVKRVKNAKGTKIEPKSASGVYFGVLPKKGK
jgi:hypothetical protein